MRSCIAPHVAISVAIWLAAGSALQTPLHAAAEIDDALKEVRDGRMPQNDLGLRQDIDPILRSAIIQTGEEFRRQLRKADQWQATPELCWGRGVGSSRHAAP